MECFTHQNITSLADWFEGRLQSRSSCCSKSPANWNATGGDSNVPQWDRIVLVSVWMWDVKRRERGRSCRKETTGRRWERHHAVSGRQPSRCAAHSARSVSRLPRLVKFGCIISHSRTGLQSSPLKRLEIPAQSVRLASQLPRICLAILSLNARNDAAAFGSGERSFRGGRGTTPQAAEAQSIHLAQSFSEDVGTGRILQQQRQVLLEQERLWRQHQQQPQ